MKNNICIIILLSFVCVLSSCKTVSNQRKIVGTWSDGEKLRYVFDNHGYATVYMGDQVIGGSDLFKDSALKYEIDDSKDPIALDFVHIDKKTKKERDRMAMIVKFIEDDKIQIKTFNNKKRPLEFEENDKFTFTLNRESALNSKNKKEKE